MGGRSTEGVGGGGGEEEGTLCVFKTCRDSECSSDMRLQHSFAANWNPRIGMFLSKMWNASHEEC